MTLRELHKLAECRERLDNIKPEAFKEREELQRAKDILDDILKFKLLPGFKL